MRSSTRGRGARVIGIGLVALLVVGGIVGSVVLDDGRPGNGHASTGLERQAVRASGSAEPQGLAPGVDMDEAGVASGSMPALGATSVGGGESGAVAAMTVDGGTAPAPESLPPIDAGRVIKTATLELEIGKDGFEAAHDRAVQAVDDAGGFTQNSTLRPARALFTFRVPADKFQSTLTALRELGEVKDETVTGEDVSEEYVDLDARLRHWRAQEAVFLELLTKAKNVAETVEIRRELSMIQQTIEQLEGRIRFLDDRTGFSTVTLEMFVPGAGLTKPEESAGPSLSEAWEDAWDAAVTVVGGTIITLGVLIPLAAIVGVIALLAWAGFRRRRPPAPTPAT